VKYPLRGGVLSPIQLLPQHATEPLFRNAQLWYEPVANATTRPRPSAIAPELVCAATAPDQQPAANASHNRAVPARRIALISIAPPSSRAGGMPAMSV
jgi:hypothetical protein